MRTTTRLPVSRLSPGFNAPTTLIALHSGSLCSGCGSQAMSCRRESLLTKSTRLPAGTVNSLGLTPPAASVNVNGLVGGGLEGVEGELLPQAALAIAATVTRSRTRTLCCARCGSHNQRY